MARIALSGAGKGDRMFSDAVVQLCRLGLEVGGNEPVGGPLHPSGTTGNPKLHQEQGESGETDQEDDKELEVIPDHGEVGADAGWIHWKISLSYGRT
jgi:hypothetical protein